MYSHLEATKFGSTRRRVISCLTGTRCLTYVRLCEYCENDDFIKEGVFVDFWFFYVQFIDLK